MERDLRPTSELAPALVLPWLQKLRYGILAGECILIAIAFVFTRAELRLVFVGIPLAVLWSRISSLALSRR